MAGLASSSVESCTRVTSSQKRSRLPAMSRGSKRGKDDAKKAPLRMPDLEAAVEDLASAEQHLEQAGANLPNTDRELHLFYEQVLDIHEQGILIADRLRHEGSLGKNPPADSARTNVEETDVGE